MGGAHVLTALLVFLRTGDYRLDPCVFATLLMLRAAGESADMLDEELEAIKELIDR